MKGGNVMGLKKTILIIVTLLLLFTIYYSTPARPEDSSTTPPNKVAQITVEPDRVLVLDEGYVQTVNFDFYLQGVTDKEWSISEIELLIYNQKEKLINKRLLNFWGFAPSMETIPYRNIVKGKIIPVFNPFYYFSPDLELSRMEYRFKFRSKDQKEELTQTISVRPEGYQPGIFYSLPVDTRAMITDGHDYYSHHRRLDRHHFIVQKIGIKANAAAFALDFCPVNEAGDLYKGEGKKVEEWYGFGAAVLAAADGEVVASAGDYADPQVGELAYNPREVIEKKETDVFLGNHVAIRHSSNEYSLYMHLKQNSVKVKKGDKVKRGRIIALLGNSGSSFHPHLHFQIQNSPDWLFAEGLPCYFIDYQLLAGKDNKKIKKGIINTGDIVEPR